MKGLEGPDFSNLGSEKSVKACSNVRHFSIVLPMRVAHVLISVETKAGDGKSLSTRDTGVPTLNQEAAT